MEVSQVRQHLVHAIERARRSSQVRRQRTADATRAYETFLQDVATPVLRQLANALKAENYAFAVSTPEGSVRLSSERTRDDYIEIALDTAANPPEVVARMSRGRGSRVLADERPLKAGASPQAITDDEVLAFCLTVLEPWLER